MCTLLCSTTGMRGQAPSISIIDEAAFIKADVAQLGILPIVLGQNERVMLAISSPGKGEDYYSALFALQDEHGESLFQKRQIALVCDDCALTDAPEKCKHNFYLLPSWKSESAHRTLQALLSKTAFQAEGQGVIGDARTPVFKQAALQELFCAPRRELQACGLVFMAVDPSGGGMGIRAACCAIVSFVITTIGQIVVCFHFPLLLSLPRPLFPPFSPSSSLILRQRGDGYIYCWR